LIQHTISTTFTSMKMYFNEIYLFQNSPVQPLPRNILYKCTYVPYNGTFGTSDQGQTLDVRG
jgi:hypothetical protein